MDAFDSSAGVQCKYGARRRHLLCELASPEDTFDVTLTLASSPDVTLQTYGFGGGTLIAPGGTDPFVGLFLGTGTFNSYEFFCRSQHTLTPVARCSSTFKPVAGTRRWLSRM
jgi:hypothetical protein